MRKLAALGTGLLLLPLAVGPARSAPPTALPGTVRVESVNVRTTTYPVRNAAGALLRNASYRVTTAGGNCCEILISATGSGMLLEHGGWAPVFSTDSGATWQRTVGVVGNGGEGSVVPAPNGDIVSVTWSIDRLTAYKYEAASGQWFTSEVVLHTPFFDRPWLTVAKGPFSVPGVGTVPYLTILRGGWPAKAVEFVSYDGLTYVAASDPGQEPALAGTTTGALGVATDPDMDYFQPPYGATTSPLPTFGAIRTGICAQGVGVLTTQARWACRNLPGGRVATAHVDSKGWIHEVTTSGDNIVYRVSTNGGTTWTSTTNALPGGSPSSFAQATVDFKSNGAVLKTAVAVRAFIGGTGQQDLVYVYGYGGGVPTLSEIHYVGLGDWTAGAGLGTNGPRFDFMSVAILPSGKIAASILDSVTREPAVAIEL